MMRLIEGTTAILAVTLVAGCSASAPVATGLDAAADAYVKLVLAVGRHDRLYVDAYYGPPEWKTQADAGAPIPLEDLARRARELLGAVRVAVGPPDRKRYLEKQLVAVQAHLRRLSGDRMTLAEECEALYDAAPPRHDVSEFRAAHQALEAIVPGKGPLPDRITAMRRAVEIPKSHLAATVRAALATARTASAARLALVEGESFDTELVTGKPWGAYNWYLGNFKSRIELNTDLPVQLNELLATMCHEGYPGHHAYNVLLEDKLVRGRGWIEYTVYPLYSPQSLLAEGTANVGEDLLFSDDERRRVLTQVLAPVAGVAPEAVLAWDGIRAAMRPLRHVRPEAARMLLDDGVPEPEAVRFLMTWGLIDENRAKKAIDFVRAYRSYVYNYTLGEDIVRAWLDGGTDRVARFYGLLQRPVVPSDLTK